MSFGLLDDQLHSHPKAIAAGLEAIGMWTLCLSWAKAHTTGGFVPDGRVREVGATRWRSLRKRLVACGLWEPAEGGVVFHDWAAWSGRDGDVGADTRALSSDALTRLDRRRERDRLKKQRKRGSTPRVRASAVGGTRGGTNVIVPGGQEGGQRGDKSVCPQGDNGGTEAIVPPAASPSLSHSPSQKSPDQSPKDPPPNPRPRGDKRGDKSVCPQGDNGGDKAVVSPGGQTPLFPRSRSVSAIEIQQTLISSSGGRVQTDSAARTLVDLAELVNLNGWSLDDLAEFGRRAHAGRFGHLSRHGRKTVSMRDLKGFGGDWAPLLDAMAAIREDSLEPFPDDEEPLHATSALDQWGRHVPLETRKRLEAEYQQRMAAAALRNPLLRRGNA